MVSCAAADWIEALHVDAIRLEHREERGLIADLPLDSFFYAHVPRRALGLAVGRARVLEAGSKDVLADGLGEVPL